MAASDKAPTKVQDSWQNKSLRWVCAMANGTGGILRVGCSDALGTPEETAQRIAARIQATLGITAEARVVADAPECVDVAVPMSPVPVSYKGAYYAIEGKKCVALDGPGIEELMLRKKRLKWENESAVCFTMADLDKEAFSDFRDQTVRAGKLTEGVLEASKKAFLKSMHLLNGNSLTNAAMLLFSPDPGRWQLGAYIRLGYFNADGDLIREVQIRGPLFTQVDSVMEELQSKYLKNEKRRTSIPAEAVREALVNAVCHKQYESGIPIQIRAYPTRLLIANKADLPTDWSEREARRMQASNPLNPTLANALYAAGLVPGWGTGLETIRDACKEEASAHVVYRAQYGEVSVRIGMPPDAIRRNARPYLEAPALNEPATTDTPVTAPAEEKPEEQAARGTTVPPDASTGSHSQATMAAPSALKATSEESASKVDTSVKPFSEPTSSEPEEAPTRRFGRPRNTKVTEDILHLLEKDPYMSTARISRALGVPLGTVSNHLTRLKKDGKIARIGERKGGHWEVLS